MGGLIKNSNDAVGAGVRALDLHTLGPRGVSGQSAKAVGPALHPHEEEIHRLRRVLSEAQERHEVEIDAARESGRKEAEQAYTRNEAKALAKLEIGLSTAIRDLNEHLERLDDVALLLCRAGLEQVLGASTKYDDLLVRAIGRELSGLRATSVVQVAVSSADFSDEAALRALQAAIGRIELVRETALEPGSCRIDLRLGQIELSLPGYWKALQGELVRLADRSEAL